jgi:tRNA-2-methylthio-N6-dimethylallyladenosine synthase
LTSRRRAFHVETFGCQMNVNDSEKVAGLLLSQGWTRAGDASDAAFVFVNTCAVREKAAAKLYSALGRLRRLQTEKAPGLRIGVGGCVAQLDGGEVLARAPYVDVLVGTHNVGRVPELLHAAEAQGVAQVDLDRRADSFAVAPERVAHTSSVRAYVSVMEGCNHVCSFCVVPRTRGPEVCRRPEDVLAEVRGLVERGYPEAMLLGQTVNAYRHGAIGFAELLTRVHDVAGLKRLRFTTSHPSHVTARMAAAFRDLPRLCPYLHLPVQSGSDRILREMRRGYDRAEYLETIARLREARPDLALSSDLIVGYPGETEEDFEATVELVEGVGFDGLFVFMYSPRPGTIAARLPDDVPAAEKRRRLHVLNGMQQRRQAIRNAERVGRTELVLVEVADEGRLSGRTPHFRIVHFDGPTRLLGEVAAVEITGAGANSLTGKLTTNSLTGSSTDPIL